MARIEENDVMIDFYLSPSLLQKEILNQYQQLGEDKRKEETLLTFLEDRFLMEIRSQGKNRHLSA